MGKSFLLSSLFVVAAVSFGNLLAHDDHDHTKTQLHEYMNQVQNLAKELRQQLREEALNSQSIKKVQEVKRLVRLCRLEVPTKVAELSEEQQKPLIQQYKQAMMELYVIFVDMEVALLGSANERASELLEEALTVRNENHPIFREE